MIKLNTLTQGDCLEVMHDIDDKSIDLTITSPPYDNLRTYNGYDFDFEGIAKQLYRVTKDGGVVVWVVRDATVNGSETGTSFKQALFFKEIGFNLHDTMIYAKNSYMPLTHNRYEQAFEYIFVLSRGKPKTFNPIMLPCVSSGTVRSRGGSKAKEAMYAERLRDEKTVVNAVKQAPNIFYYDVGKNDKTAHNAPFPLQLATDQISSWSNEGDTVLDPMAGSGTTGAACINTNRNYILIEQSAEYCAVIEKRLAGHKGKLVQEIDFGGI